MKSEQQLIHEHNIIDSVCKRYECAECPIRDECLRWLKDSHATLTEVRGITKDIEWLELRKMIIS